MKKIYLLAILAMGASSVFGQGKLDLRSLEVLRQYQAQTAGMQKTQAAEPKMVTAVVRLSSDNAVAALQKKGIEVLRQRDDLAIVQLPMDSVESVVASDALRQMQFSRPVRAKLDEANKSTGADKVHEGTDLDRAYTGESVIVSLIDQGIDPNHITFRKKGTTESRVKCLWTALNGKLTAYDTPSKISSFTSDLRTETHGTHVAGIIGGSYTSSSVTFEGVAPGADFAMVGLKSSTDTDILLSIETLIDYAKANGKPLVINISLGSNDGPHDGSSVNDQYYAKLGKEAFICIAAGNEGDLPIAAYHKFSSTNTEMRGLFDTTDPTYGNTLSGAVEFWGDNSAKFTFQPVVVSTLTGNVVYEMPVFDGSKSETEYRASTYFSGSFTVSGEVGSDNNRYNVYVSLSNAKPKKSTYAIGYIIKADNGRAVYAYADGWEAQFMTDVDGWDDDVDADGTINMMACPKNIIAVGAYTTKTRFKTMDGQTQSVNGGVVGDIAEFSSYGTLIDGRKLPHVCAPGHTIISSYSTPYVKYEAQNQGISISKYNLLSARVEENGKYYFWGDMSGTSMSTPYVTGTLALWLEANPKLTYDEVIEVINETSTRDSFVKGGNQVQWGAGKINVYEGLKSVLRMNSGVGEVNSDKNMLMRNLGGNVYEMFVVGEPALVASVYDLSGRKVAETSANGDTVAINLDGQQKGVYVVSVAGESTRYTKKVVVK